MKKILIAVDDTQATREIFSKCTQICKCMAPESIILLFVEKYSGHSFMNEMIGDGEAATLREVLEGTEYKEALDKKAATVLGYYKKMLEQNQPVPVVQTMVKAGNPAEEIIETSKEEDVAMILIGSRGQRAGSRLFMGSVSREVANTADRPVLIVK